MSPRSGSFRQSAVFRPARCRRESACRRPRRSSGGIFARCRCRSTARCRGPSPPWRDRRACRRYSPARNGHRRGLHKLRREAAPWFLLNYRCRPSERCLSVSWHRRYCGNTPGRRVPASGCCIAMCSCTGAIRRNRCRKIRWCRTFRPRRRVGLHKA